MGERKEDLSSVDSCSRKNNRDAVRKRKADSDDDVSLPAGWEIRHSRSRNGKVYYVNSITKVSTWRNPCERSDNQGRLASEENVKLKAPRSHLEPKQPYVAAVTRLKEKQAVPDMTASVHSNKRKAEKTTSEGPISNKVQKSSNISTVQNTPQCQKQNNKTQGEKSDKWVAKHSLDKQHTVESCNSARTKDQERVFNCKATTRDLTAQDEHTTSQTDKTSVRRILKPSKKTSTSRPVHDCSQNFSTGSDAAREVKDTVSECNSSCSKIPLTSVLDSVSATLRALRSSDYKSRNTNSSPVISVHLLTTKKSTPELDTSSNKQNKRSQILSDETLPRHRPAQYNNGSSNNAESYRQRNSIRPSQYNDGSTNSDESCHQRNSIRPSQYNDGSTNNDESCHQRNSIRPSQYNDGSTNNDESYHQRNSIRPAQYNDGSTNNDESYHQRNSIRPAQYNDGSTNNDESYHQRNSIRPSQYNDGSTNNDESYQQRNSIRPSQYNDGSTNNDESYHQRNSIRPSQYNDGSTNNDESYHQGNSIYLNKINMGLTPQTSLDRATHSPNFSSSRSQARGKFKITDDPESLTGDNSKTEEDSKSVNLNHEQSAVNSNLFRSSCHDSRLYSPDSTNWSTVAYTGGKFLNSEFGSCNAARNLNISHDTTVWTPSPSGTEEEQDIEDMEVDEGLAILSNLQDVRTQTSSILQESTGVLTETVTQAKSGNQSAAVDSARDVMKKQVILVVDTNVFISSLKFVQDIMNRSIPGYQGIILVMPWVVMQELDYLKSKRNSINNLSKATSLGASKAIRFIHSHIIEKNSQLVGQTPQEAAEKTDLPLESNDDRILQCCLQFEQKYPGSLVVLLTRDVNLINKAVIMGISAASNETLSSHLKIPKLNSDNRKTNSTADTPKTRKRSIENEDIKSVGTKLNARADTGLKADTASSGHETASSTRMRLVSKKANLGLPDKSLPADTPPATPASSKVSIEHRRLPQTDAEKAVVMNKFEAVWKLIHDMKSQIGVILAAGRSHPNYSEAVELLKGLRPLILMLKDDFSRCLYLSPVILWEHEAEFTELCTHLNTFYAEAQTACADPSQQVKSVQLLKHFHDSDNRSVLFTGLEQLSAFITDVEAMLQTCS